MSRTSPKLCEFHFQTPEQKKTIKPNHNFNFKIIFTELPSFSNEKKVNPSTLCQQKIAHKTVKLKLSNYNTKSCRDTTK